MCLQKHLAFFFDKCDRINNCSEQRFKCQHCFKNARWCETLCTYECVELKLFGHGDRLIYYFTTNLLLLLIDGSSFKTCSHVRSQIY